jgi:hypothetical protein
MSKYLRIGAVVLVVLFCLSIFALFFAMPSLERVAREEIIGQLQTRFNAKVELRAVNLSSVWPLGLRLDQLKILSNDSFYSVEVERIYLRYHPLGNQAEVEVVKPLVELHGDPSRLSKVPTTGPAKPGAQVENKAAGGFISQLGVLFKMTDGQAIWKVNRENSVRIEHANLSAEKSKLFDAREPVKLDYTSDLIYVVPVFSGQMSLRAHTQDLRIAAEGASSEDSQLELGGLRLKLSGKSNFINDVHDWRIGASVDDLAKIPKPPDFVPAQNWQGKLKVDTNVTKTKADLKILGHYKFDQVTMDLHINSPKMKANGPAGFTSEAQFTYANGHFEIKDLTLDLDLTRSDIRYANIFKKDQGILLKLNLEADANPEAVMVRAMAFQLFTLKAEARGQMGATHSGKIQWKTDPVALAGWEKLLLPLAAAPVQGDLELRGLLSGSFSELPKLSVEVSKIAVKALKGVVKYRSTDGKVELDGPVSADFSGHIAVLGKNVKSADVHVQADLSALGISADGIFQKKSGELFLINLLAKQQKQDFGIEQSTIRMPFGVFTIGGVIREPLNPILGLTLGAEFGDLEKLKAYLPAVEDQPLTGALRTQITVNGKLDAAKPWYDWPLKIAGNLRYRVAQLHIATSQALKAGPGHAQQTSATKTSVPGPFFPSGKLTENLELLIEADLAKFTKDNLVFNNTILKGKMAQGIYSGALSTHGFGGTLKLKNIQVPLLVTNPKAIADVHFESIKIESLIEFLQPSLKVAAKGPSAGDLHIETQMPGSPGFLAELKAKGEVGSENIWINTEQLAKMLNDQIAKIPGVGKEAIKLDALEGMLRSRFQLANQIANPLIIDAYDKTASEIHIHGSASLEKTVDLVGEFKWANAPISGCIKEGNADEKGRVVVPVALKGPIDSPSWQIATNVILKMGEKALICEATKALQSPQVEDAIKKGLNGLFGQ